MTFSQVIFSSCSDHWRTPSELYQSLDSEFAFTLDPVPGLWRGETSSGLLRSWQGQTVFLNPPYRQAAKWVARAYGAARYEGATVVCLLAARTDTNWFHNYCIRGEIRFIRGRLSYDNLARSDSRNSGRAPFPSMIVIFRPDCEVN